MTVGLLLAAGAGRRMGTPKALVHDADGTSWLRRSVAALLDGGCTPVHVVLGAGAEEARTLLADLPVEVVRRRRLGRGDGRQPARGLPSPWATRPRCSSRSSTCPTSAHPSWRGCWRPGPGARSSRGRRTTGRRGTRSCSAPTTSRPSSRRCTATSGRRPYLAAHDVVLVECGDLATGADRDSR